MRHWLATIVLVGSAVSAQTFVVDAANGPGTHYTTIAAAVAAVPDGSTLLVRPGVYDSFVINGKGLTVLGGPGVDVRNNANWPTFAIEVGWTSATQPVVLTGIRLSQMYQRVSVHDCSGPVLIEDLSDGPRPTSTFVPAAVWIYSSSQVLLRRLNVAFGTAALSNSHVAMESCTIRGPNYALIHGIQITPDNAMRTQGGSTQIVDCTLIGGYGYANTWGGQNREAIAITNGNVRIRAPARLEAGNSVSVPLVPAISGTGTLRIDPAVVLVTNAQPQIGAGLLTQTAVMPAVLASSASPGGTFTASALGPIGNVVILILGLSGPPATVSGIADTFWIDPAAYYFAAFGVPQPAAPLVSTIAIPGNPGLLGVRLAWQSVSAGQNGFEASNPTMSLVR